MTSPMFERYRPTPSRLSAEAAAALPRYALLGLLAAFLLPGLFARGLWPEDAAAFGRMWTMAHGAASDWWLPNVAGQVTPQDGPLPFWFGAWSIRLLGGWLGEAGASRLSTLLWCGLALAFVWAATRRFARGEAAQPLAPAFGRETEASDYARLLADIAVLLFVSTLGILVTLHVTNADTAAMALVAGTLYGIALTGERPLAGAAVAGLCVGAMTLTRSPVLAGGLLLGCDAALALCAGGARTRLLAVLTCSAIALGVALAWPLLALQAFEPAARRHFSVWTQWLSASHGLLTRRDGVWLLRNASWYVWPLWPLAGWALYAWRHHLRASHIAPSALLLAGLVASLLTSAPLEESKLVLTIAPMAVLAAFGVPTLRRTLQQWVDWFAIAVFTLVIAFVWAYFMALITGAPRAMAHSVMRLMPGYTPDASTAPLLLALAVTGLWIGLVVWRIRRRPPNLWRGAWLSAAGVTSLWLISVALFLPAADYNRSYRGLAEQVGRRVGAGQCVLAVGVTVPMRAILAFEGGVHFARDGAADHCRYALQPQYRRAGAAQLPATPNGSWDLLWEGRRTVRADETWRLWRLVRRG
jgi:4-amino-4-deoxy-L-arabinose transferase-like glycosyltransferase